jgi:positive regulator of sigma E activity
MLRILFSRATLFPCLGLILLAAGAAFPEGSTVGIVLIVIGANVAFYSLKDFSHKFEWGENSRSMLTLCGLGFLAGLGLVAACAVVEGFNRWLALLCGGLYLCLFAVWIIQQPVGWAWRAVAVVGAVLMLLGGIFGYLAWQDWRVFAESQPTPQDITLTELLRNGHGSNRFIRLREFRFCDQSAAEKADKQDGKSRVDVLWIPLVSIDGERVRPDGSPPPVPARVTAVAGYVTLGEGTPPKRQFALSRTADLVRKKKEADGYECVVVNGIRKLDPKVRDQLREMAPDTDFGELLMLDWRRPGSAEKVYGFLAGGVGGFLIGLVGVLVVYRRAWKAVTTSAEPIVDERTL